MKLLIDDTKLNLLLEKKKQYIGKSIVWDSLLSAVSFLISVMLSSYEDYFGVAGLGFGLKLVFSLLGIGFTIKSIIDIYNGIKHNYSYEDLLSDINKLNEIAHSHSIVVIKDGFRDYPNRYLVYEDTRWNCQLFLNYKENPNNEDFIKRHISSELKIATEKIRLTYVSQKLHEKFSESAQRNKLYSHRFYLAEVSEYPEHLTQDSFECDGRTYYWRSIQELEKNERVQKVNSDILNFVKELF